MEKKFKELRSKVQKILRNIKNANCDWTLQISLNSTEPNKVKYCCMIHIPTEGIAPITWVCDSFEELEQEGFIDVTVDQVAQYLDSNTRIKYVNYGARNSFIDYEDTLGVLKVIVNKDHSFYRDFVSEAYQTDEMKLMFELFLLDGDRIVTFVQDAFTLVQFLAKSAQLFFRFLLGNEFLLFDFDFSVLDLDLGFFFSLFLNFLRFGFRIGQAHFIGPAHNEEREEKTYYEKPQINYRPRQ